MNRRTFVKTLTIAGGTVVAVGPSATAKRAAAKRQDTITLRQWYHQYGEEGTEDAVKRYAEQYTEANPNVEVEVNWVVGDYPALLNAALLTDDGPDLFESTPNLDWVRNGLIAPLDDLLTPEVRADYTERELQSNTIEGVLYGLKIVVDTGMIYYRPSLLEAAGVAPPTTMDELIAAAQALTDGPTKGLFLGNDGGISAMQTILPWSAGSDFITPDNQDVFDNPGTVAAYEKLRELNQTDALLIGAPTDWFDPSAFIQNLCAMAWGGLWMMPVVTEELGDDFGVIPWPALTASTGAPVASPAPGVAGTPTPATFLGGWSQLVSARSANVDAAKAYAKWLWVDNADVQRDFNLEYGFHVPPRRSVAAGAEALQGGPPAQAVEILNNYARSMSLVWTAPMGAALGDAVTRIVRDGADATQEVAAAAEAVRAEVARLGL